mmetsp:Transcript_12786/g.27650  ORF Transcript_12786/g.27650 Transcript_12786/m.27650 type:complete len:823 (-) Transcript_12786:77-2545(-)
MATHAHVLRIVQSRASAAAAASTVTASAWWLLTPPSSSENDTRPNDDGDYNNAFNIISDPLHRLHGASLCRCEASPSAVTSKSTEARQQVMKTALQRSKTLRQLDLATTKSRTLASAYAIDPLSPPLGEGAFGAVHLATNRTNGEKVAIKRIPKSQTDLESFQREVNALLRIKSLGGHPHICSLRESFDEGSDYFLILDFISGGEMFDHLIKNGAFSESDTSRLIREAASALAFLHGIGVVHADLKPENLMLSTDRGSDAVVKLVDFGCAETTVGADEETDSISDDGMMSFGGTRRKGGGLTAAYRPPESQVRGAKVDGTVDMWALGVILYIMLCGVHPFDLSGDASDLVVERRIRKGDFPLRGSRITKHLSESAIELIEKLMERNPRKRLTASEMLQHEWVRGITASTDVIAGSDERLSKFRKYKTKLQKKFFEDVVKWSDDVGDDITRKTSLIERSFRSLDEEKKGFLTPSDLGDEDNTDEGGAGGINMTDYNNLLSENMVHKHFGKGEVIYKEGDIGNEMFFIVSGSIEVKTKSGSRATRGGGDIFGEGALLHPRRIRSATITCKTPVHAMSISREYFEKYLSTSESGLLLTIKEKDKIRKRNRAKAILKLQNTLEDCEFQEGEALFTAGDEGDTLYIVESGKVDVKVRGKQVFSATPGNLCGEHSVLTGQKRNSTAICASPEGCRAEKMNGKDFRLLLDSSPGMEDSLRELSTRRDFKKAVVHRLKKEFPYDNPREAFDAVKGGSIGRRLTRKLKENPGDDVLSYEDIRHMMRSMDRDYTDEEIQEVMEVIDLTNSGDITFDEFKKVFIANIKTSASI